RGGAGILVAPYPGDFTSGKPVALRAWATAIDCERFNRMVADSFLIERFATHGNAPEKGIGGSAYPEGVVHYVGEAPAAEPTGSPPSPS
ncbi:MAG: hypothetical protein M3N32_11095, partial [Actinomycetota bacterium]|nr:hypothetical protein [Actinomycetota bacterium]